MYHIECNHSLSAGKEEREALSYLSSLCFGSPFITQMMSSLINKYIIILDCPNDGIKKVHEELLLSDVSKEDIDNDAESESIAKSVVVVSSILQCHIKERFLSLPSIMLLNCLALFGSLPIPQSVVVAISEKIVAHCSSEYSVLPSEVWGDLCSLSLLQSYPSLTLPTVHSGLPLTSLYYLPDITRDACLARTIFVDHVVCAALVHSAIGGLATQYLSSRTFGMDCLYFPELVKKACDVVPTEDMYLLKSVTIPLRDCYLSCV